LNASARTTFWTKGDKRLPKTTACCDMVSSHE
jgi:hypothetical protein